MNAEHLITLVKSNCNNLDDLCKISEAVNCLIEAIEIESELKQSPTLEQVKATLDAENFLHLRKISRSLPK
jgi:hypothetical protein